MANTSWTNFVRDWAAGAGVSYPCASTDPRCREDYEAWKAKNGMKATVPRKPRAEGVPKRKYVRKDTGYRVPIGEAKWESERYEGKPKRKYVRKAKVDKMALSYIMNPVVATGTTMKMRKIAASKASAKADKTWIDDWAKYNGGVAGKGATAVVKPKRTYVRKPKPPTADSLSARNPTLAEKLRIRALLPALSMA